MYNQELAGKINRAGNTVNRWNEAIAHVGGIAVEAISGTVFTVESVKFIGEVLNKSSLAVIEATAVKGAIELGVFAAGAILAGPIARHFGNQIEQHRQTE